MPATMIIVRIRLKFDFRKVIQSLLKFTDPLTKVRSPISLQGGIVAQWEISFSNLLAFVTLHCVEL